MRELKLALLLLAFSTIPFSLIQTHAYPAAFELSHDDGEFDYGWSDFYPMAAMVRFSPPSPSWRIKSVRVHAVCSPGVPPISTSRYGIVISTLSIQHPSRSAVFSKTAS